MKKLLFVLVLFILVSCGTTKTVYVPVETIKTEYKYNTDSIYCYDSIYYYIQSKNDTIYEIKYKYKVLEKYKTDTVVRIDSIPIIKEVEITKEVNHLYWWQKLLIGIGGSISVIILCYLLIKIYKFIR